jgi:hypothetical protein
LACQQQNPPQIWKAPGPGTPFLSCALLVFTRLERRNVTPQVWQLGLCAARLLSLLLTGCRDALCGIPAPLVSSVYRITHSLFCAPVPTWKAMKQQEQRLNRLHWHLAGHRAMMKLSQCGLLLARWLIKVFQAHPRAVTLRACELTNEPLMRNCQPPGSLPLGRSQLQVVPDFLRIRRL